MPMVKSRTGCSPPRRLSAGQDWGFFSMIDFGGAQPPFRCRRFACDFLPFLPGRVTPFPSRPLFTIQEIYARTTKGVGEEGIMQVKAKFFVSSITHYNDELL